MGKATLARAVFNHLMWSFNGGSKCAAEVRLDLSGALPTEDVIERLLYDLGVDVAVHNPQVINWGGGKKGCLCCGGRG